MTTKTKKLTTKQMKELSIAATKIAMWADSADDDFSMKILKRYEETLKEYGVSLCPAYLSLSVKDKQIQRVYNHICNVLYDVSKIIEAGKYTIEIPDETPKTAVEVEA